MTKQEEFLYIVQMTAIGNAINLSTQGDDAINKYRHVISGTGFFNIAHDAIRCSKQIPEDMCVVDAANQFVTFFLDNQRDMEEDDATCPSWCLV
ncbi:Uncharacterised protein [Plesiomonas shigelloides]|uniref:hypothetical protein n=1 Tax=Plesiomonas shigelloides TaxID=703 RepID=UPI0007ED374C|nr:hypothetical protein [Plesiomonas shigelloides]KAB7661233.1 hypothetical protein GBN25_15130 [Plesiomonas shigelloides]SBT60947.1 Uncharacterised protein [Plesiomonas shigelloides]